MSGLSLQLSTPAENGFSLDIDCQLPAVGVTAIYGPSGSGKTSLLNCIAGLKPAGDNSLIRFKGTTWQSSSEFMPAWERRIGFVFQDARLFPHLSVAQNLEFALKRRGNNNETSFTEVVEWLQLGKLIARLPESLSAGQTQRVAIGRALLSGPQMLLMDEPLANLDHVAREECLFYLRRLRNALDLPIMYVSHDIEEVSQIADHLVLLENGHIEAQGSLLELCSALDTRLSHEEQAAAIVLGTIQSHDAQYGLSEITVAGETLFVNQIEAAIGQQQRLRIPARDVSLCKTRPQDSSILNIVPVEVSEIEETGGSRLLLRLALGEQYLLARITRKSAHALQLTEGDKLFAQIKSAALLSNSLAETTL
ncbi:MAG: molybdenum ABC transporter ATP-binding protein [Proteobacteria bacterium]|nr:molybdenum ABC transporter ATP-binding protein [Pseudomonadota bacterium]